MIITKTFEVPPIDETEVLRYAGYKIINNMQGSISLSQKDAQNQVIDSETQALLAACLKELQGKLEFKACYRELQVVLYEDMCDFDLFQVRSKNLARHLQGANRTIIFAATLGVGIDRLITKYASLSPAKALMFQAIGAERIEALCDVLCKEIGAKRRFSPGYGDLSLDTQRNIFAVLECEKRIGLTLNNSLLMSPTKSVTAFVAICE